MLDAAALCWYKREYHNPADALRCVPRSESGKQQDSMHYSLRYLVESFIHSREEWASPTAWESAIRSDPKGAFPSSQIGCMCDQTFKEEFPAQATDHPLRKILNSARRLGAGSSALG